VLRAAEIRTLPDGLSLMLWGKLPPVLTTVALLSEDRDWKPFGPRRRRCAPTTTAPAATADLSNPSIEEAHRMGALNSTAANRPPELSPHVPPPTLKLKPPMVGRNGWNWVDRHGEEAACPASWPGSTPGWAAPAPNAGPATTNPRPSPARIVTTKIACAFGPAEK
jgi:hypothetical protein